MEMPNFGKAFEEVRRRLGSSLRDLLPIIGVVAFFQIVVFQQPLQNLGQIMVGIVLVAIGLTLFVFGLEVGLFPLGEEMAYAFAKKSVLSWLVLFAFALGFGTTFAEPALIAVAGKAGELAAAELDPLVQDEYQQEYSFALRATVATAVGSALVLGVFRILLGFPLHLIIVAGYILVMMLTPWAPPSIVAVAYDSGGVTTSTITVPLTTALGVGLASSIRGRSPLLDGFGLIALASLIPILFVLVFGIIWT
jgi:hypothetical protein